MNIFKKRMEIVDYNDAALVMASLGGNRAAFSEIVTRYQNLLCSLAYSSVGDLKHSEDIAQEAFVEAWKKLNTLCEPEKLKSWLCGIVRFKVSHFRRKELKQPVNDADDIVEHGGSYLDQSELEGEAISAQQQSLLWQTLEKLPETYREPLILFYREQCSVESVAEQLDLSEDTVKQRLSRGRKLLQSAMITFVEDTLSKTKQGTGFALSVLAAINVISPPAKATALSAGAVKTGSLIKWSGLLVTLASLSGLVSSFFGVRAALDQSRTQRERSNVILTTSLFFGVAIIYVLGMFGLTHIAENHYADAIVYAVASQALVLAFVASYIILMLRVLKGNPKLRALEREVNPQAFLSDADQIGAKQREYKSRFCLAGAPLFHFRFGTAEQGDKPVFGWVAGGDQAYGLLFAWGGLAIAPISVGIVSVGVISIGAVGVGLLGIGTIGIGLITLGASAIGYKAYASFSALGWDSAFSGVGFSIAKEAALGPFSFAKQINNDQAADIANLSLMGQSYLWILAAIFILVVVPAAWHSNKVRQRMRNK
ncbi:RNA polymerase sigma factor [Rheinheimera baltica]|uniref:RNA polymerase sigma factor n=1 Tax=Rheinheimera baltica TaxID=67576 RepID=UPI00273E0B42|nr:sigma-70 family RNA polymerase sigma factor [Rheinheimera baltica]MDP5151356.1 sigma-70 family RNA polymerase sigma factor [Rheinheimera baltica]